MHHFRFIFESLPTIAAFLTILICGRVAFFHHNPHHRFLCKWATLNAMIMLFAQSSWSWSVAIEGSLMGTELANYAWTIHNASWAALAIYATIKNRKYVVRT